MEIFQYSANTCKVIVLVHFKTKWGHIMGLLDLIILILIIGWLFGFTFHIAGGLIHLLLVIAVIVLIIRLIRRV